MKYYVLLALGLIFLFLGLAFLIDISDDDERGAAAAAFVLGILGVVFICASGG